MANNPEIYFIRNLLAESNSLQMKYMLKAKTDNISNVAFDQIFS